MMVVIGKNHTAPASGPLGDFTNHESKSGDIDNIDFNGCFDDLTLSDQDGDGYIKETDFLGFIQAYGLRNCYTTDSLTVQQVAVFNTLACLCRDQPGGTIDCCEGGNAQISTAVDTNHNSNDDDYLTSVCKLTDATIPSRCSPVSAPINSTSPGNIVMSPTLPTVARTPSMSFTPNPSRTDFTGCFNDLAFSDRDGDGYIKQNEFTADRLTLQQSGVFTTLACMCRDHAGSSSDCCEGGNAQISTAGVTTEDTNRTTMEKDHLTSICKLTDSTISFELSSGSQYSS
jgi:EF-hand domain pair